MTTVAQMIEWMQTLPPDAIVECGVENSRGYERCMEMKPVDIEACDVISYTSGGYGGERVGKVWVMIRGE